MTTRPSASQPDSAIPWDRPGRFRSPPDHSSTTALYLREGRRDKPGFLFSEGLQSSRFPSWLRNLRPLRPSPAAEILKQLKEKGARVSYHDPRISSFPHERDYRVDLISVELTADYLASVDCAVIVTDHEAIDRQLVAEHAALIIDTRNVIAGYRPRGEVWKARGSELTDDFPARLSQQTMPAGN